MAGLTLNEEQTKLLRLCLKYAEPLKVGSRGKRRSYEPRFFIIAVISTKLTGHKPNWEKVTEEADLVSTSAA